MTATTPMPVEFYQFPAGFKPAAKELVALDDAVAVAAIRRRFIEIGKTGNLGDYKPLPRRDGLCELRFHTGQGHRVYFKNYDGQMGVFLIGTKNNQTADINAAHQRMKDFENGIGIIADHRHDQSRDNKSSSKYGAIGPMFIGSAFLAATAQDAKDLSLFLASASASNGYRDNAIQAQSNVAKLVSLDVLRVPTLPAATQLREVNLRPFAAFDNAHDYIVLPTRLVGRPSDSPNDFLVNVAINSTPRPDRAILAANRNNQKLSPQTLYC